MSAGDDDRLVAALLLLHEQLLPIVTEIQAGDFDQEERREFVRVLAAIAAEVVAGLRLSTGLPTGQQIVLEPGGS